MLKLTKDIDKLIKAIPDGKERLQCVEFGTDGERKLLLISAYISIKR